MKAIISAAAVIAAALAIAPARAATVLKSYEFEAQTTNRFYPVQRGRFSFTYDEDTLAANLLSIDYSTGTFAYDTGTAAIKLFSTFQGKRSFILGGVYNAIDGYDHGTEDFFLVFDINTNLARDFTFTTRSKGTGHAFTPTITLTELQTAVPEPSTWGMLIVGFGLAGFALRRPGVHPAERRALISD